MELIKKGGRQMLAERYLEIINELKRVNERNREVLEVDPTDKFEDEKAYSIVEYLTGEIEEAIHELEHLTREVREGVLLLNSQGRYNLDTMPEFYFTCGNIIEVSIDNKWYRGRVEHDSRDYYFCNYEGKNLPLTEGMKARIRVDRA